MMDRTGSRDSIPGRGGATPVIVAMGANCLSWLGRRERRQWMANRALSYVAGQWRVWTVSIPCVSSSS